MRRRAAAVAAALATVLGAAPGAQAAAARFAPCPAQGYGARCADVTVPLDRTGAVPGTVRLRTLRFAARRAATPRAAVVYLSGGPGGAGLEEARYGLQDVRALRADHDLVAFDQRGTGASGLLRCPELEQDARLRSTRAGARCARRLGARRTLYGTRDSVEDLEAVRIAVGAERLVLYGVSYGTELALAYARAHPDRVERLVLDSVVDPDETDPFGLASFRAIAPSLAALCPADCTGIDPDPGAALGALAARLQAAPRSGRVWRADGSSRRHRLTALALADLLFDADYVPVLRAAMPAAVRAAAQGDATPALRLIELARPLNALGSPRSFSAARYATSCEEKPLPWPRGMPTGERDAEARRRADALGAAAFAPLSFEIDRADEIDLCLRWPGAGEVPAGRPAPAPYPGVPALILQGGEDLRTPPEVSASVARALPGAARVVVPGIGHAVLASDPSRCGARRLAAFLRGGRVAPECPRVATGAPATGVPPRSLRTLERHPGVGGPARVARTVTALDRTLDDVVFVAAATYSRRGAGLRGGTFLLRRRGGVVLHGVSWVPGVRVSGAHRADGALRLRISGPAAARGRVVLSPRGVLRGRLGGRRIAVPLGAGPPRAGAAAATSASIGTLPRVFRHRRALMVRRDP